MNLLATILLIIIIVIFIFYKKTVNDNQMEEIYKLINLKLKECQISLINKKEQYKKYKNLIDQINNID